MKKGIAKKAFLATIAISFLFLGLVFAANEPTSKLKTAISDFCGSLTNLLPVAAMLMVVVGAVIYAAGQVMGAETRARSNVWATAALTGAMMGLLITAVTPPVLTTVYGQSVSCGGTAGATCSGATPYLCPTGTGYAGQCKANAAACNPVFPNCVATSDCKVNTFQVGTCQSGFCKCGTSSWCTSPNVCCTCTSPSVTQCGTSAGTCPAGYMGCNIVS